ncbi:MAG: glycosyl transferase, partial [Gemmatimonadota bacterium]|nr:glycosyl transferase [Gemmatimonadota bacterium]
RRRVFEAVGGYRPVDGPEDYDLVLRIARAGPGLANVPDAHHGWRLGPHRLSERSERYAPEAFRRLKVAFLREEVPAGRPLVIRGAGRVGKAFARTWRAETGGEIPLRALVDLDPRKIGQTIHDAPVIAPPDLLSCGGSEGRPYTLAAVGSPGARGEIRRALEAMGQAEIDDFRAVA